MSPNSIAYVPPAAVSGTRRTARRRGRSQNSFRSDFLVGVARPQRGAPCNGLRLRSYLSRDESLGVANAIQVARGRRPTQRGYDSLTRTRGPEAPFEWVDCAVCSSPRALSASLQGSAALNALQLAPVPAAPIALCLAPGPHGVRCAQPRSKLGRRRMRSTNSAAGCSHGSCRHVRGRSGPASPCVLHEAQPAANHPTRSNQVAGPATGAAGPGAAAR